MSRRPVNDIPYMKILEGKLEACANAMDDLTDIYSKKFLTDVEIKTKTNSFPAHKVVLCARSPVFKLMFSNDMREKNSDSIQLDDMEDENVQQLLNFLYSDKIENLQWDHAIALYYAADKYEIRKLKLLCSYFLVENLTQNTVIELLVLADTHSDSDLLKTVEDYIRDHEVDVFCSEKWEELINTNPQLAVKTMHSKYKQMKVSFNSPDECLGADIAIGEKTIESANVTAPDATNANRNAILLRNPFIRQEMYEDFFSAKGIKKNARRKY